MDERKQGLCPNCNSIELDYQSVEWGDNYVYYPFTCQKCNAECQEFYDLVYSGTELE